MNAVLNVLTAAHDVAVGAFARSGPQADAQSYLAQAQDLGDLERRLQQLEDSGPRTALTRLEFLAYARH